MKHSDDTKLYGFMSGKSKNDNGLRIENVWKASDLCLEVNHCYIQWIFPLDVPSEHNTTAPYIHHIEDIKDQLVCLNMRKSLDRMLSFYGFKISWDTKNHGERIVPADNYKQRTKRWLKYGNHNMLRLTRIERSLKLFEMPESKMFTAWLKELSRIHPDKTYDAVKYWFPNQERAMEPPK